MRRDDTDRICSLMLLFSIIMCIIIGGAIRISMLIQPDASPVAHAAIGFFGGPVALVAVAHAMKTLGVV